MDIFDEFWLFVRKYLFSILLILAGITFLIMGITTNSTTNLSQSNNFLIGAIVLFLLGFISLYFILDKKISRTITIIASAIFLIGSYLFIKLNIKTVEDRIIYIEEVKQSENLAKQGLTDIQELQEAYDRKYRKFAPSFEELIRFAQYDSIRVLVRAEGDIPSRRMTVEEGRKLGLRYPKAVISEEDAIKLNLIIREYDKIPVAKKIFDPTSSDQENRAYDFDLSKLTSLRTIEGKMKEFAFKTAVVDSTTTVLIQAYPPYGPQKEYDIKDTLQLGSLFERNIKSNWK